MKKDTGIVQFIKFGLVGVSNTAVDWIVYFLVATYIITSADAKPTVKAISFLVAVINSYIWNTIWTFRNEYKKSIGSKTSGKLGQNSKIFIKFVVVSLIGWGINYLVFRYFLDNLQFNDIWIMGKEISTQDLYPLIAASFAAILWNFFGNKFWTYKISASKPAQ